MKSRTLLIKNMVCRRCKTAIRNLLENEGLIINNIQLGSVTVIEKPNYDFKKLKTKMNELGFELIEDATIALVEEIKVYLIKALENENTDGALTNLSQELFKSYSVLSKSFSKSEGITLERYFINLKIERVKELIQINELNFSEIAYSLNYKSGSHLAKQFKQVTGMSMTSYKQLQNWNRKSFDQII